MPAANLRASVLLSTLVWATWASAQEVMPIDEGPDCRCGLEAELWTILSDFDGRSRLARPISVTRTEAGHYLVVPSVQQGTIVEFDSTGEYVGLAGRPGQGPSDFMVAISMSPGRGDTIAVFDAGNGRIAMLATDVYPARTARTIRAPARGGQLGILADGGIVVLSGINRSGSDRLHVLDPEGTSLRSFMPDEAPREGSARSYSRRMSTTSGGLIAVAHAEDYVVEIWDSDGRHLRDLVRTPDWFPNEPGRERTSDDPFPLLHGVRFDPDGRLWTISHLADADWDAEVGGGFPRGDGTFLQGAGPGDGDRYSDTIVEVLDPVQGRLLASWHLDAQILDILPDGFGVSYREDESGYPFVDIWGFEL